MRVTILGSGTSAGVPTLGCECDVCRSTNPLNKRTRASAYFEHEGHRMLIDCGPDFRTQAIARGIQDMNDCLITHTHADHVNGLDDLRAYNMIKHHEIDLHAEADALDDIRVRFAYCFRPPQPGGGIPQFNLSEIEPGKTFQVGPHSIMPLRIFHGILPILGFRIGDFAYITDVSRIPDETYDLLDGIRVLLLGALRWMPHPTHMNVEQALEVVARLRPQQTWFIHMCHDLEHNETNQKLPDGVALAYDGLTFEMTETGYDLVKL